MIHERGEIFEGWMRPYWFLRPGKIVWPLDEPIEEYLRSGFGIECEAEREIRSRWVAPVSGKDKLPPPVIRAIEEYKRLYERYLDAREMSVFEELSSNRLDSDKGWASNTWQRYRDSLSQTIAFCNESLIELNKKERPGCPYDYDKKRFYYAG